jgi:hypothetical protein
MARVRKPLRLPRRRHALYYRRSQHLGLIGAVAVVAAVAGVSVANSFVGNGQTVYVAATGTPVPTARASEPPTRATPTAVATSKPSPRESAEVAADRATKPAPARPSPSPSPSPSAKAQPRCPSAETRLSQARALVRHPSALPQASVVTAGARDGTLGTADLSDRTVTLYLRSCAEESATKLAIVWMYEAGQFVDVDSWDKATRDGWRLLRNGAALDTTTDLRQDVAAVFGYWQLGTTEAWQSPVAPPAASLLPKLATYLHMS